jgi:hypothetical protein
MQRPKENILTPTDKLLSFKKKIQVWKKHLSSGNIEIFSFLLQIQDHLDYKKVIPSIISHLASEMYLSAKTDQFPCSQTEHFNHRIQSSFLLV